MVFCVNWLKAVRSFSAFCDLMASQPGFSVSD